MWLLLLATVESANVIETADGPIEGYVQDDVLIFRGVPYGAPPVGDFRLRPPQPVKPWTKVRKCEEQKPICPQIRLTDFVFLGEEDCLYLDVYIPAGHNTSSPTLPVFFWIYGGGYTIGDGFEFGFYDGKNLARKHNYIVVTPNYRLGALGFLALEQLKQESNTSGNYGHQDQRAAMLWVQRNIKAFGGDPSKVTILGESAGAMSVAWHLASEASKGLFRAAVMESGTADSREFFRLWKDGVSFSEDYLRSLNCDPSSPQFLTCVRKIPVKEIMFNKIINGTGFRPLLSPQMDWGGVIDGSSNGIKDLPFNVIKSGQWNKVPLIAGTNENEGSIFVTPGLEKVVPGVRYPLDEKSLNTTLLHFFNQSFVNQIRLQYPTYAYKSFNQMAGHILRDYFFVCASRRLVRTVREQQLDAYLYHFTYTGDFVEDPILGVYHSAELQFVFDNAWPPIVHEFTERDRNMSDTFTSFWANFVHDGNPNGAAKSSEPVKIAWPMWSSDRMQNVVMDVPPSVEARLLAAYCDLWDQFKP